MIGPRGNLQNKWGERDSPETFFDLTAEEVCENPPPVFPVKTPKERRRIMALRNPKLHWNEFVGQGTAEECGWIPDDPQVAGGSPPTPLSKDARKLAAQAVLHQDFPVADTQVQTGSDFVELFRGFVK